MENTLASSEQKAATTVFGLKNPLRQSATFESRPENKNLLSQHNENSSTKTTPESTSSRMLVLDLTSDVPGSGPYWNDACEELQSVLWSPQVTDLQGLDSTSSDGPSNCTAAPLSNWKKVATNPNSTLPILCVSSPVSLPVTTANAALVARKIRVFPENETQWNSLCGLHRTAYNMAVAAINSGRPDQTVLRREIREELRQRWSTYTGACFVSTVSDEAVNNAFATLKKCMKRWKEGQKSRLQFRSKRDVSQGFYVQKCSSGGQLLPRILGKTAMSEAAPEVVAGQLIRVTRIRGRYFATYRRTAAFSENQAGGKVVALDPGVRTFVTSFSNQEVCKFGDGLHSIINDLSNRIDGLSSIRDRIVGECPWMQQRRRNLQRSIWKASNRIADLVDDLHRRAAYDLVTRYDVILLPMFETSQMVAKPSRKIRRKTVRVMQRLRFFAFGEHLSWMCRKYGKTLLRVNESYTSKTDSRSGEVKQIGGAKTINGFDRDTNGARGILLRALSRAT